MLLSNCFISFLMISADASMILIFSNSMSCDAFLFWKSYKIFAAVERNVTISTFPFTFVITICYHFKILFNTLFQIRWTVTFTFFRSRKVCHFICQIRIEIYSSFFSISSINLQTSSWISSSTSSFGRSRFWFTLKSGCWYFEGILFVLKLE